MARRKRFVIPVLAFVVAFAAAGCGLPVSLTTSDETAQQAQVPEEDVIYGEITQESIPDEAENAPDEAVLEEARAAAENYAYQTLNASEQTVYNEIVQAFTDRAEEAEVSTLDISELERAFRAVRSDHCEFFWVGEFQYVTYTRGDEIAAIEIEPAYTVTPEEQEALQQQIDAEADRMLADVPADGGDFAKALYVYETLISEVDYGLGSGEGQTIVSAFVDHQTVCQGYSYATQYLLRRLGIPCTTVTGTADGESHAWNLVFLDGAYYYLDTTWGNSSYVYRNDLEAQELIPYKYVDYDYFGMTTEMLLKSHQPDGEIPLPECTATADNYYVHEGLYIDEWDIDRIGNLLSTAYFTGEDMVRICFADDELYAQAKQYFLTDGNLFRWCEGLQSVNYLENPLTEVMVVVFY